MRGRNVFGFNKEIKLPHKISNYIEVYLMVPNDLVISEQSEH